MKAITRYFKLRRKIGVDAQFFVESTSEERTDVRLVRLSSIFFDEASLLQNSLIDHCRYLILWRLERRIIGNQDCGKRVCSNSERIGKLRPPKDSGRSICCAGAIIKSTKRKDRQSIQHYFRLMIDSDRGNSSGEFCYSLNMVDVASGWSIVAPIRNKAQRWTLEAILH